MAAAAASSFWSGMLAAGVAGAGDCICGMSACGTCAWGTACGTCACGISVCGDCAGSVCALAAENCHIAAKSAAAKVYVTARMIMFLVLVQYAPAPSIVL